MHPHYCPPRLPRGVVKQWLRRGKALVLPPSGANAEDPAGTQHYIYQPRISTSSRFGRLGKILPLRYHPLAGSSHPAGLVLMRCNWDVQCMDRVFVDGLGGGSAGMDDDDFDFVPGDEVEPWPF